MKISIIGQGYVGQTLSIGAASAGHEVVGFDLNAALISNLAMGKSFVPGVEKEVLLKLISENRFLPTTSEKLIADSEAAKAKIEERLIFAYTRLRENAKNGLSVVPVQRDCCGGCFNKIPPQRQLEIETKRKVIVCEHCGRILVPASMTE